MSRQRLAIVIGAVFALGWYMWANHLDYNIVNRAPASATIVAFGDSLTSGVGAGSGSDYPAQLAEIINRPVLNRGVPGETTAHAMRRLERDVLGENPGVVILFLGGNDMLQRLSQEEMFSNLDRMVEKIQRQGAMVVLVGLKGFPFDQGYGAAYKALARRRGCVFVPDAMGGILTEPGLKADQVHPNGKGYRLIAEKVADALRPFL